MRWATSKPSMPGIMMSSKHQIGRIVGGSDFQGLGTVLGQADAVIVLEQLRQQRQVVGRVVDDQDGGALRLFGNGCLLGRRLGRGHRR